MRPSPLGAAPVPDPLPAPVSPAAAAAAAAANKYPVPDDWLQGFYRDARKRKLEEYYGGLQQRLKYDQLSPLDPGRQIAKGFIEGMGFNFQNVPPFITDAVSGVFMLLSALKWLSLLVPIAGPFIFAATWMIQDSIANPSIPRNPPPRSYLLPEELKRQQEREANPVPVIMENMRIAPTFDYLLKKNQLAALKAANPASPRIAALEDQLKDLEDRKSGDEEWIPFICTNIGAPPFRNEAFLIFRDLHYSSRKTLIDGIDATGLTLSPALAGAINAMKAAPNENAFMAALNTLTDADRNILLGLCDLNKYHSLKYDDLRVDITAQHNNPAFESSIKGMALNRYIDNFYFHGVRGVANVQDYKRILKEKGAQSNINDFRAKILGGADVENNLSDIWGNNGLCVTSSGDDEKPAGINVNFSAKRDSMNTLLHEGNHAAISAYEGGLYYHVRNFFSTLFGKGKPHHLLPEQNQLVKDIEGLQNEMQSQIHERLIADPNFPGMRPMKDYKSSEQFLNDLGLTLTPDEKKILLQMMDDPSYRLIDTDGRSHPNNIIRESSKIMQVHAALNYFNNLENGPNYAANLQRINNFSHNPAHSNLIECYSDCYTQTALASGYNFGNPIEKTHEVLARVLPILPVFRGTPSLANNPIFKRIDSLLQRIKGGLYRTGIPRGLRSDLDLGENSHTHSETSSMLGKSFSGKSSPNVSPSFSKSRGAKSQANIKNLDQSEEQNPLLDLNNLDLQDPNSKNLDSRNIQSLPKKIDMPMPSMGSLMPGSMPRKSLAHTDSSPQTHQVR